jgi:hypothetical protein
MMRLCPHPVGRTTGFSHRVGASMANGLRPLSVRGRAVSFITPSLGAAFTLPCCALRGISGGATMRL